MDCKNVISLLGEFLDGELVEQSATEVRNHLKICKSCAELTNFQKEIDQSLRTAVKSVPVDTADLGARVRKSLPSEKPFFRAIPWKIATAALAVVFLAVSGLFVFRHYHPAVSADAAFYADLYDDYQDHGRRMPDEDERLDDEHLKNVMTRFQQFGKVVDYLQQQNYTLVERRFCTVNDTNFLHLIYTKDGKYLSVFFKKTNTPMLKDRPTETISNVAVHECVEHGQAIAALEGSHGVVLLVGELSDKELHKLADATAQLMPAA